MSDNDIGYFIKDYISVNSTKNCNKAQIILKITDKKGRVKEFGKAVKFTKPIVLGDKPKDLFFEETLEEASEVQMDDRFLFMYLCGFCAKNTAMAMIIDSDKKQGYDHEDIIKFLKDKKIFD